MLHGIVVEGSSLGAASWSRIVIPREFSLISFDDHRKELYPYTVSSLNFGLDQLGSSALHWLVGDVPLRLDRSLGFATQCRVNHQATIGMNL